MSLTAWQDALAQLIVSGGQHRRRAQARKDLSRLERQWLRSVPSSAGFQMMCKAQRWWRRLAVTDSAPLALGLLQAVGRGELVQDYFATHNEASLFPLLDGIRFLEYLIGLEREVPHLQSVATFEHGILRLSQAASLGDASTRPQIVRFDAPPLDVIGAILSGSPPPEPSGDHWLLLAPDVPNFARMATPDEVRLLHA